MGQKPNWCAIDRTQVSKEEFWNGIQPHQYSTEDLFYLKERTKYIIGSQPHYITYWLWSGMCILLFWFSFGIAQLSKGNYHTYNVLIASAFLFGGIVLLPLSYFARKRQLRQKQLLNNCARSLTEEIERRDVVAYLSKYQPHEYKIS